MPVLAAAIDDVNMDIHVIRGPRGLDIAARGKEEICGSGVANGK